MEGWIKLHRKMVNWEWYTDDNVKAVFLHLLLCANHKPNRWRGIEVGTGELITSYKNLSEQTGHSIKQVRTALNKLETTGEIERTGASQYTRLKLLNYCEYQASDFEEGQEKGTQGATEGQTTGKQRATNNNDKNYNIDKNYNRNQNKKNYYKNKNKPLSCTPSFDIAEIERRAVFDDDYDI